MNQPKFSIIIPSCNEGEMLHMTIDSIVNETKYNSDYEILIVDDGSTDGSCDPYRSATNQSLVKVVDTAHIGVSRARNAGFETSKGKYVVFLDAHCKISPNWLNRFERSLQDPQVAIVGPTFTQLNDLSLQGCGMMWTSDIATDTNWYVPNEHPESYIIPLTPGGCQAFSRDNFLKIGRYDEGFARWGSEDLEICLRSWKLGYHVKVDPNIIIQHYFRTQRNFTVDQSDVIYNFLRMIYFHFSPKRIERILGHLGDHPDFEAAAVRAEKSNVKNLRASLDRVTKLDDDWFFSTFA